MPHDPVPSVTLSEAAQTTLRMLIASYFIAAASGSIPGSDTAVLFSPVLPAPLDRIAGSSVVMALSIMVMIGSRTRLAAMLLGLMTFCASYLHMVDLGLERVLGFFWRDMALIAALMLTYGGDRAQARRRLGLHLQPASTAPPPGRAPQTAPDIPAGPRDGGRA
ncbi:hypothetical protein P6F26_18025 [Roseibacterium sp. SDUM158017]|uniref:hypothetical protein n=1 Tax=Roseicyclus salinarum TaxID=3036773 RepID=UPI0024152DF8|nr:hypothetical protein [Roseibacterium sp. SDUM158017]MDG4650347.1 hypothetical protein [Roseibacterium sp. SDUM158017]